MCGFLLWMLVQAPPLPTSMDSLKDLEKSFCLSGFSLPICAMATLGQKPLAPCSVPDSVSPEVGSVILGIFSGGGCSSQMIHQGSHGRIFETRFGEGRFSPGQPPPVACLVLKRAAFKAKVCNSGAPMQSPYLSSKAIMVVFTELEGSVAEPPSYSPVSIFPQNYRNEISQNDH